ncbi:MAG: hypothetical protein EXX96DRAFT_84605 [Benjaminiella poitrasii]|nr:MAG: hypothetical protein EXX96DRAFT_84605 [Benjaminiella poitrasii]
MIRRMLLSNNSNSHDLIHEIDKLVLKFCDTSIHCDSLESLHDCMERIFNEGYQMVEDLDISSVTTPLVNDLQLNIDQLCEAFESYFMDLTYDVAFFKITQLLLPQDKELSNAVADIDHLDFSQVALPSSIKDGRKRVHAAISEFERIGSFRTPAEKLDCLLNTISELTKDTLDLDNDKPKEIALLDSDSLIPLLLMTLIRSKVPHLIANLVYMKEYTFERNIKTGKYGYALSTFEGVLAYILDAHPELSSISKKNISFWTAIQNGNIVQVKNPYYDDMYDVRDARGNNALMIACIYGQSSIAEYLIQQPDFTKNNDNCTPLMCAIKHSNSLETVKVLLNDRGVRESIDSVDNDGNNAVLYACHTNNIDLIRILIEDGKAQVDQVNTTTHDSVLHVAAQYNSSLEFMVYVMKQLDDSWMNNKNKKGQTFYYLIENLEFLKYLINLPTFQVDDMVNDMDQIGRSPLMVWASRGRLDLVEVIMPYATNACLQVDNEGKTLLHLAASHLDRGLVLGNSSLDDLIEKMKDSVNIRDWSQGNTPLHLAAELTSRLSSQHLSNVISFIKALVKNGANVDAINLNDERPSDVCKIPEIMSCIDELHLTRDVSLISTFNHGTYQYSWTLTRTCIEKKKDRQQSEIFYVIQSGQIGKPESMRTVKRKFEDFSLLRKGLLYEIPELFLPTLQQIPYPDLIDFRPPPFALIEETLGRLQSFMMWLQYHPLLQHHDLVLSFVRSSLDLQKSTVKDNSFSRRQLLLEKISDTPFLNGDMMNSKGEEYFLKYTEGIMMPLKSHFMDVLTSCRKLICSGLELERGFVFFSQDTLEASAHKFDMFSCNSLALETLQVCSKINFERSYVSPWPELIRVCQMSYVMMDGILLSLQRPFTLIKQRCAMKDSIEAQKELLRKSKGWQEIFTLKEKKRQIELDKDKVIERMNELNSIDRQIKQSHKTVSDELAHFQDIHPKIMVKAIRKLARSSLQIEKNKLHVLNQTLAKWEKPLPSSPV